MKTPEEIKHTLRYCWCKDEKYQCIKCPYNKENDSCDKALDADALAYIQQLEDHIRDLTKMVPRWISVKERLPNNLQKCLTYSRLNGFKIVCYTEVGFIMTPGYCTEPTHWMPLPESPEVKNANE